MCRFQVKALIKMMQHFNWSYISILHSSDIYSEGLFRLLRDMLSRIEPPICIDLNQRLPSINASAKEVSNRVWLHGEPIKRKCWSNHFRVTMFLSVSVKFLETKKIIFLSAFWTQAIILRKGARRLAWRSATKTLTLKNFNSKWFHFKYGMMVRQLRRILEMYMKFDFLNQMSQKSV